MTVKGNFVILQQLLQVFTKNKVVSKKTSTTVSWWWATGRPTMGRTFGSLRTRGEQTGERKATSTWPGTWTTCVALLLRPPTQLCCRPSTLLWCGPLKKNSILLTSTGTWTTCVASQPLLCSRQARFLTEKTYSPSEFNYYIYAIVCACQ